MIFYSWGLTYLIVSGNSLSVILILPDNIYLMGGSSSVPAEVQKMQKVDTPIDLEIIYCGAWGGLPEANYASSVVKTVFPNARINQHTPGPTRNLVIKYQENVIYDKKGGDGSMSEKKAVEFANKLKKLTGNWEMVRGKHRKANPMKVTRETLDWVNWKWWSFGFKY